LTNNIENQVFRIGVFGSFSSGKSTLINHLLGDINLLPVDEDRCTAAYTLIQRANDNNAAGTVRIEWKSIKILIEDLKDCLLSMGLGLKNMIESTVNIDEPFILKWIKENNQHFNELEKELDNKDDFELNEEQKRKKQVALTLLQGLPNYLQVKARYKHFDSLKLKMLMQDEQAVTMVQCLEFYHDHPLLRHVQVIDSPGSGSVNLRDSFLAQSLVKQSHAILFLTEATAPISKYDESNLLAFIGKNAPESQIKNLFVLANKTDLSENKNNPERIVEKISARMEKHFKGKCQVQKIFPISCKTGLNLDKFTNDLNYFLQADKDNIFLTRTNEIVGQTIKRQIDNVDRQLKERDESLQDITNKIEAFKKDKVEKRERISSYLDKYSLIYYESQKNDQFNIKETLVRFFDDSLNAFQYDLKSSLNSVDKYKKKEIIKNLTEKFIKDVVMKSLPIIGKKIEEEISKNTINFKKEFQRIESELVSKYKVFDSVTFINSSSGGVSPDGLISEMKMDEFSMIGGMREVLTAGGFWTAAYGLLGAGIGVYSGGLSLPAITLGISYMLNPVTAVAFPIILLCAFLGGAYVDKDNPKLIDEAKKRIQNSFKNDWKDKEKRDQKALSSSIKDEFDKQIGKDLENIKTAQTKSFNMFLESIEEKLHAQYDEKNKTEIERQTLQHNRTLISEEFKFLKGQQSLIKANIQALYTENNTNTN